jgi:pyrroloquinoline quinone (PQQ) biosynthesis protein C
LNIELQAVSIQENTKDFVQFTFGAIRQNELHKLAALFTFGREDLIPSMFIEIVKSIEKETGNSFSKLRYYLERHIEVDGGEHGPMALNMMEELCGTDEQKWKEATLVSVEALKMRIHLWDGVLHAIQTKLPANNH